MTIQEAKERWWAEADRDPIHLAAADWFGRLRNPDVSLEETLAWQSWMSENPRHAEAFTRVEEVSNLLQSMPRPTNPRSRMTWKDEYDASVPLSDWRARPRPPWLLAMAASVLVAGIAVAFLLTGGGSLLGASVPTSAFVTAVGENRTVQLADGSKITLGGDSKVEVALGRKMRHIDLMRGEAFFVVAKDPSRPFKVHAGKANVIAVGTEFNVHRGRDRVVVDVVEGRVVVEPASTLVPLPLLRQFRPKLLTVKVAAGEQTSVGSAEVEPVSAIPDVAAATSWQAGRLAFRLQPLREVLEDVNRYALKPVVILDDDIGNLRVTGTVVGNNVSGWAASLGSALNITVVEEPERIVLRR